MIAHFDFCGGPQLTSIDDRAVILNSNLDAALSLANKKKKKLFDNFYHLILVLQFEFRCSKESCSA